MFLDELGIYMCTEERFLKKPYSNVSGEWLIGEWCPPLWGEGWGEGN